MSENCRLNIELILAKNFIGQDRKIPAAEGYRIVKESLRGCGIRKRDIAEARKELRIRSEKVNGEYWWIWENEQTPESAWEYLSKRFWRQVDEGKRD